jgi:hypothetical protein
MADVLDVGRLEMQLLLSPLYDSSAAGLSVIASFINYIHHNGPKTQEILHALTKTISFTPLVDGLSVLARGGSIFGYYLPVITAPLHTLIGQAFLSKGTPQTAFEQLLQCLPVLTAASFKSNVQCSVPTAPFIEANSELFSSTFSADPPTISFLSPDVRGTESVEFTCDASQAMLGASDPGFRPVPASRIREVGRVSFASFTEETCLYTGPLGTLLVPSAAQPVPLATVHSQLESASELISIAIDCSISMTGRFKAAQNCFRKIVTEAAQNRINSMIGVVQFGYKWKTTVLSAPGPVTNGFKNLLDGLAPDGPTMLWEGLHLAADQLLENSKKCDAPLRIIAITDGGASYDRRRVALIERLVSEWIRLDVIIIGAKDEPLPLAVATGAKMTGGYLFKVEHAAELHSVIEHPAFFDPAIREYGNFSDEHPNKVLKRFSGMSKKELLIGDDHRSEGQFESITIDTSVRLRSSLRS